MVEESQGPGPFSSSVQAWFMTFSRPSLFQTHLYMWEGLESLRKDTNNAFSAQ